MQVLCPFLLKMREEEYNAGSNCKYGNIYDQYVDG